MARRGKHMHRGSIPISDIAQLEELEKLISGQRLEVIDEMLEVGSEAVHGIARRHLQAAFMSQPEHIRRQTGGLINSMGVSPIKTSRSGHRNVKIGFRDYHPKNNAPNAMIASTINAGRSDMAPRPWLTTAGREARKKAVEAMEEALAGALIENMTGGQ